MTTHQLNSLNLNLEPTIIISDLKTNNNLRNKLVNFFYKLKKNYDNYQLGLHICPIKINWEINNPPNNQNVLNYNTNDYIPSKLSVNLYHFIISSINNNIVSYLTSYIREALRIDNLIKNQAYLYFRKKESCHNFKNIDYREYYFMQ